MKPPFLLQTVICLSLWALANLPRSWSMETTEMDFNQAYFMKHAHSYLAVEKVADLLVHDFEVCALSCVRNFNCFSLNMATQPSDASGHYFCELLVTDKYNASKNLRNNLNFDHYSIETPCFRNPCKNGGTCVAKYETGGSECVCKAGFTGEYCEESREDGLEKSAIVGQKTTYLQQLRTWLMPVKNSSTSEWRRCWHGNTDGFAASTFHSGCDNKGPTVTIVQVRNYVFGGYTDQSWESLNGEYKSSTKSFLFTLYNTHGYRPQKLDLRSGKSSDAICTFSSYGPTFGRGHDLRIINKANTVTRSYTNSGNTYQAPHGCPDGGSYCSVLAGSYNKWKVSDIEVLYETI